MDADPHYLQQIKAPDEVYTQSSAYVESLYLYKRITMLKTIIVLYVVYIGLIAHIKLQKYLLFYLKF